MEVIMTTTAFASKIFLQENTSYELNQRLSSINCNTVKALQGIPRSQAR
jgi:hypothetical protein